MLTLACMHGKWFNLRMDRQMQHCILSDIVVHFFNIPLAGCSKGGYLNPGYV